MKGEIPDFLHNPVTILGRSQEIRLGSWVVSSHNITTVIFLVSYLFLKNPCKE